MKSYAFPEANAHFRAPADMHENQVRTITAYKGTVNNGKSCDGAPLVVVAHELEPDELQHLIDEQKAGRPPVIYLSMLGGLAPHFLCLSFKQAINPA